MSHAWNAVELDLITADYFAMLLKELQGTDYRKVDHRNRLMALLPGRSKSSIEMKHQNISAILLDLQFPYIPGYKPLSNYQEALKTQVRGYLESRPLLVAEMLQKMSREVTPRTVPISSLLAAMGEPPEPRILTELEAKTAPAYHDSTVVRFVDFAAIEERNRSLGEAGELFVMQYEHARLYHAGEKALAEKVEHVSKTKGDGLGYDIESYEVGGKQRLIEVKTTASGPYTPFYVSAHELQCSSQCSDQYYLYRVYQIRAIPRIFSLQGALSQSCIMTPTQYRARVGRIEG